MIIIIRFVKRHRVVMCDVISVTAVDVAVVFECFDVVTLR